MARKVKDVFINLPVKDLQKSVDFFSALGFGFNDEMTDENASCMIIGDHMYVMLLVEPFFQKFTKKQLTDSAASTEVIVAISADSKAEVDEMVEKAIEAGGAVSNDKMDDEYMYGWSFQDLDGHLREVVYMPES
ncbi:Glyoxalase-like domain protein [Planococcus massiliensis]|uniref:Glyoxalase-like domain protein n=1 Tax=Planococcus massiliensis TaxID=1499687 RepID=A0A098EJG4_9BACL|nr:VOC family protein [Planococcus massiliensis]CEG22423.1 Glyoxalase-like domain protein [Planococcus massiliensis]